MKKVIIYLIDAPIKDGKIYNVVSRVVLNQKQEDSFLLMHHGNISKVETQLG
jgi:hypothetical protein